MAALLIARGWLPHYGSDLRWRSSARRLTNSRRSLLSSNYMRRAVIVAGVAMLSACASSGGGSSASRTSPNRIARSEIRASNATNAYELISRLRPNWLRASGAGSISGGTARSQMVLVYLDGQRLEDLNALRSISITGIESAEWIDRTRAATVLRDAPAGPIAGAILLKTQ